MKTEHPDTDWRRIVYDALTRYCADAHTPEENTGSKGFVTDGAAQTELADVDFRTLAGEELPLTQVAALCLVVKACVQAGNINDLWEQGATTILQTRLEARRMSWSWKRLLPDNLEFSWDFRSETQPMFRMVQADNLNPRRAAFDHGLMDAMTRNDDPVVFLASQLDDLHPAIAMFDANVVCIDEIDRDVLPVLCALRHPGLSDEQIELLGSQVPDLSAVSLDDLDCVVLAFRQNDPSAIPTMIARYLEESCEQACKIDPVAG